MKTRAERRRGTRNCLLFFWLDISFVWRAPPPPSCSDPRPHHADLLAFCSAQFPLCLSPDPAVPGVWLWVSWSMLTETPLVMAPSWCWGHMWLVTVVVTVWRAPRHWLVERTSKSCLSNSWTVLYLVHTNHHHHHHCLSVTPIKRSTYIISHKTGMSSW